MTEEGLADLGGQTYPLPGTCKRTRQQQQQQREPHNRDQQGSSNSSVCSTDNEGAAPCARRGGQQESSSVCGVQVSVDACGCHRGQRGSGGRSQQETHKSGTTPCPPGTIDTGTVTLCWSSTTKRATASAESKNGVTTNVMTYTMKGGRGEGGGAEEQGTFRDILRYLPHRKCSSSRRVGGMLSERTVVLLPMPALCGS
jgi:hypothetical protein